MEPKDSCPIADDFDIMLVPTVGITRAGVRLGYGHGFYDRYLSTSNTKTISLTFSKQVVKSIPSSDNDKIINWIVTEDETIDTSKT